MSKKYEVENINDHSNHFCVNTKYVVKNKLTNEVIAIFYSQDIAHAMCRILNEEIK